MQKIAVRLAAAAAIVMPPTLSAGTADAQTYYARERLAAITTSTTSTPTTPAPTSACGPMVPNKQSANGGGGVIAKNITTAEQALAACEAYAKANPTTSGLCDWDTRSNIQRVVFYVGATSQNSGTVFQSAWCNPAR